MISIGKDRRGYGVQVRTVVDLVDDDTQDTSRDSRVGRNPQSIRLRLSISDRRLILQLLLIL